MKKIGIITFHQALNYGAVLQTYALQEKLQQLGNEVEIIDYFCPKIVGDYKNVDFSLCHSKKDYLRMFKYSYRMKKRAGNFKTFNAKRLHLSAKYTPETIEKSNSIYDVFVTGSDQVFNDKCTDLDKNYFLDFVKDDSKKISYAASFGFKEIPKQYEEFYRQELSGFEHISVREAEGREIVHGLIDKEVTVNVDPTLAISKKEWQELISDRPVSEKYIFVYSVMDPKELVERAKELSQKTNLKIIYLHGTIQLRTKIDKEDKIQHIFSISPEEFVNYIYHAEYVLTNSFHGTVFSCVFRKKFGVEFETLWKYNGRSKELLQKLDLLDHEISSDHFRFEEEDNSWDRVERLLENEQKMSENYLRMAIEKNK